MPDPSQHTDGNNWDAATPGNPVRVSPFAELLGFDLVERTDGRAVVECTVVSAHANPRGIAHGGIMSARIDTACGGAVAYQPPTGGTRGGRGPFTGTPPSPCPRRPARPARATPAARRSRPG